MKSGSANASGFATACFLILTYFVSPAHADVINTPLNYLTGHGDKADPVAHLTWGVLLISAAVVIVVSILLAWAIWHRPGLHFLEPGKRFVVGAAEGGTEWMWIGVSLTSLALIFTVVWTMAVLARVNWPAKAPALTIEVTGHEWWWQVRYLNDDPSRVFATADEIHIPTGVPVRFRLVGADVIHSFWVPALSGKTDVIPGQINETWLEAREPGTYWGQCTEYCGLEHAHMALVVVAQPPSVFRTWWDHQLQSPSEPADAAATQRETEFATHCGACHAVRGTTAAGSLGPDLSHLMTRQTLAAGELRNDSTDLVRWISDPQAVKPGALMQKPELTPAELADIHGYLATLN